MCLSERERERELCVIFGYSISEHSDIEIQRCEYAQMMVQRSYDVEDFCPHALGCTCCLMTCNVLLICLSPVLASSGIDYDVKIWAPLESEPCFDVEAAEEVEYRIS